jgi:hypothetical protein
MVLVSALTLERSDAPALMNYINLLQENSNLINNSDIHNYDYISYHWYL